jgi:hypothetical protein
MAIPRGHEDRYAVPPPHPINFLGCMQNKRGEHFNMRTDADLNPIRSDRRFEKILEKYKKK